MMSQQQPQPQGNRLPEYRGYPNYPTWAIAQRIDNNAHLREEAERICNRTTLDPSFAADDLREWLVPRTLDEAEGIARDLAAWAVAHCHWRYLADVICDRLIDAAISAGVDAQMAMWDDRGLYREA